jgi:hypothetical protein
MKPTSSKIVCDSEAEDKAFPPDGKEYRLIENKFQFQSEGDVDFRSGGVASESQDL